MSDSTPHGGPNPSDVEAGTRLVNIILGYQFSAIVCTAAEFGIADILDAGPMTSEEIAKAIDAHAPSVHRLMRALVGIDVFQKLPDGRFANNTTSSFLRKSEENSLAWLLATWNYTPLQQRSWGDLPYSIKTGKSAFSHVFGMPQKSYLAEHPEYARHFSSTMTAFSGSTAPFVVDAYDFGKHEHLVDVGGNRGNIIGSILSRYPKLKGSLLDLPHQVADAPALLAEAGVGDRCTVVGGDMFKEVPAGGDAYLMRRVLHDWDDDDSVRALKNIHKAARPGAKLLIVEIMLGHQGASDAGTMADLEMLVINEGGKERTLDEFKELFRRSGFRFVAEHPVVPTPFSIVEGERID